MAEGTTKPILEVVVGDSVLAEDPETGERGEREVTHLWVHEDTIIDLQIEGHVVATTADHPFWNATDEEWQRADALESGDLVLTADGTMLTIDGMDWGSERTATAFNLTIHDIHTYFVAVDQAQVLVHNTCPWDLDSLSASGQRVMSNDGLNRAAQKLQQHGGQGNLPVVSGNVAQRNALATDLLDDILTAPGTRVVTNQGGNFAGGRTFIDTQGNGAVYDADGVFQFFGVFR